MQNFVLVVVRFGLTFYPLIVPFLYLNIYLLLFFMINLCLDTNIYLSFYHFTDNDLNKLKWILTLIKDEKLKVILPEQIENEFRRNRESKISEVIKKLDSVNLSFPIPRIFDSYSEKDDIKKLFKSLNILKNSLTDRMKEEAIKMELTADQVINEIFSMSCRIPFSEDIWELAKLNYDLGNPPGKDKSYGDSIIRHSLLSYDLDSDIYFVSGDWDFSCSLNPNYLTRFLDIEWKKKRQSDMFFYPNLIDFFNSHFPDIKLEEESIKNKYITGLWSSPSFDKSRVIIKKLSKFENFSYEEIKRIFTAAINNNQIYFAQDYSPWIWDLLIKIISPHYDKLPSDEVDFFRSRYDQQYTIAKETWYDPMDDI